MLRLFMQLLLIKEFPQMSTLNRYKVISLYSCGIMTWYPVSLYYKFKKHMVLGSLSKRQLV